MDRRNMWFTIGIAVVAGGGLMYAGSRASASAKLSHRTYRGAREMRRGIEGLGKQLDRTNSRMDALDHKLSYGFKNILGVDGPS